MLLKYLCLSGFYFIDKVDDVGECFADCVGGLISVVAKDGVISVLA